MEAKKKILHNRPIFYSFLALILSITATRFIFQLNVTYLVLISVVLITLIGVLIYFKNFYLILIIISVMLLGVCLFFVGVKAFEGKEYVGTQVVEGRISDDIQNNAGKPEYKLVDVKINGKSESNMYAIIDGYGKNLQVGDIISFESEIQNNKLFNLGSFYLSYYRDNAPYLVNVKLSDIEVVGRNFKLDERFRVKVKDLLYGSMGTDNGATAFAVLFGNTNDINDEIYDAYQNSGILHLLAVSGLNVTFLVSLLGYILKLFKVNRWTNFLVCFFVLFAYIYLCGFAPSIVRAGIMGIIFLACSLSGKCYDGLNTLGLAGIITLVFSPLSALDNGFLMSYFCVFGILTIHPTLTKGLQKFLPKFIADSFSISISSQIMILPFMASFYTNFNFLSFFLNLIVVPVFGVIYPILFVVSILCACLPFLSFLLTFLGYGLSFVLLCANFFAGTSLAISLKPINAVVSAFMFAFFFSMSQYVMVAWKNKIVLLNIFATLMISFALVFDFAPIAIKPSILNSYTYDYNTVILTNSQNNSLVVDGPWFSAINNGLISENANNIVGHIALNYTLSQKDMEKLDSDYYFYNPSLSAYEGCEALTSNLEYSLGGFKFTRVDYNSTLIGVKIEFDGFSCFVLNGRISYNTSRAEFIDRQNYDYLLMGDVDDLLVPFEEEVVLTYDNVENSDHNFKDYGSMLLLLSEQDYNLRGID